MGSEVSQVAPRRISLLVAFPALYVGIAAIREPSTRPGAWLLVGLAVLVALLGRRAPSATATAIDVERSARLHLWASTGLSIAIATAALSTRAPWAALAREIGAWVATVAAVRAVGRVDGDVGLAPAASEAAAPAGFSAAVIVKLGVGVLSLAWGSAAIVDFAGWLGGESGSSSGEVVAAGMGALAIFGLGATALLVGRARRLELAVPPRALACTGAAASGLVLALALALSDAVAADTAVALGAALASVAIVRLARSGDPHRLARHARRAMTLVLFGGPVAALAAIAVEGRFGGAGGAAGLALILTMVALVIGTIAPKLEEPFLPVKGILIEALVDAREAARAREARNAMAHAMVRLREASGFGMGLGPVPAGGTANDVKSTGDAKAPNADRTATGGKAPGTAPSPELWLLHPTRVLTVNAAGYLEERRAELPANVFDVALGEPYATLRTSVLRALEVRRADLRPLLAWLEHRDALFATVIAESEDPDGLLVVPTGARLDELTLEEATHAKLLADAFVAVSQATSAKARHLERERDLKDRLDALDDEMAKLRHTIDLDEGRHVLASTRLARPATVGIYSAASRMAYDALERRISQEAPLVVAAPAGLDPVPYVARAHLGGPRKRRPLVVVDATSSREHDLERWTDEKTSPLALADRGLLVLVDGAALPREVQVLIARTVAERRPPWERGEPLDVAITLTVTQAREPVPPDALLAELVALGRLAPELAARFEAQEPVALPGFADRAEDLRSIVADRLAREGLRIQGRPVGIDAAAFVRLVEHPFLAEEAELAAIVTRLVAIAVADGSDVVRRVDVDTLGLAAPDAEETPERKWPPEGVRRKARSDRE